MTMKRFLFAFLFSVVVGDVKVANADEGMWTFNHLPKEILKKRYKFEATDAWLDHVRLASVRFNSGGSGSFVSSTGLVMTNHHVGADCVAKVAAKDHDYIKEGFFAKSAAEELKCPDLELNIVVEISDVTADVKSVGKPGMDEAAVNKAEKEKMSQIEKTCADKSGGKERCDVVTLYQGGVYNLYRYQKYTDVRLVFAPEFEIAFFGGDPDNFMFPRYDLDVAFFRAYDGDKAVQPVKYLKWNKGGAKDGELVFTSGNPGNTERLDTMPMLETLRDVVYPVRLAWLRKMQSVLKDYGQKSGEADRQARTPLFSVENSLKALGGYLDGLKDPVVMKKKADEEARLRKQVAALADAEKYQGVWESLAGAEKKFAAIYKRYSIAEGGGRGLVSSFNNMNSMLFGIAKTIVRITDEKTKPSEKRLREYRDSNLPSIELGLYTTAPIYDELEVRLLENALDRMREELGDKDAFVVAALGGKSAKARAEELVRGTKMKDVATRKVLAASKAAVDASKDPMILFAKALEAQARAVRTQYEDQIESVVKKNLGLLGKAQFQAAGLANYPDATFTLRLSFGKVAGYVEKGAKIPAMTDVKGLYARSDKAQNKAPWALPPKWVAARGKLDGKTPMNFVSTNDIIGGNSGSPVVNRKGEVVGLIFDGNIQSLAGAFVFEEAMNRAVSVHTGAITAALRTVYGAASLADELEQGK